MHLILALTCVKAVTENSKSSSKNKSIYITGINQKQKEKTYGRKFLYVFF